ncbi:MAG: hypothetical protein OXH79_11695 [Boseongicola sp.]|nr:hypothetical protein [Boseongicola sp.]
MLEGFGISQQANLLWDFEYSVDWSSRDPADWHGYDWAGSWRFTKSEWDAVPWGAKIGGWMIFEGNFKFVGPASGFDVSTLPLKPSWSALWAKLRPYILERYTSQIFSLQYDMHNLRDDVALAGVVLPGLPAVHVGDGIEHMPALIHAVSASDNAGGEYEPAFLRTSDKGDDVPLWTKGQAHSLLGQLTSQTNEAESAYNVVRKKYDQLFAPIRDERGGLAGSPTADEVFAAREAALARLLSFIDLPNLTREFEAARAKFAGLPSDLPTLKAVLTERLEAAATGQQKRIKGALSQQAIDNWAACVEIDQALREVALECAVGAQRVGNASDATTAQVEFSAAVRAVEAVSPVNIPEVTHAIAGRRVTIRAVNPTADPAIRGPVTVLSTSVASTDGSTITGKVTASDGLPVKDSDPRLSHWDFADDYGGKVRIAVEVRNVCGPATYEVDLEVTANGGIRVA